MNFQAYLQDTYRIIKEEPLILILGGLLVQLLTIVSMGILAGPILGGYFLLIIYYLRDNKKPSFNDIFSGLQQFGNLFPYFLVLLLIFIGFMLLILPGLLLATWWLYVLPLMVDRRISFSDAMRLSMDKVNQTGFLMHLVFLLLVSVIPIMLLNFLSAMIPVLFVLKILLPPFQAGCLASLYIDQFGKAEPEEVTVEESQASGPETLSQMPAEETAEPGTELRESGPAGEEVADAPEGPDKIQGPAETTDEGKQTES